MANGFAVLLSELNLPLSVTSSQRDLKPTQRTFRAPQRPFPRRHDAQMPQLPFPREFRSALGCFAFLAATVCFGTADSVVTFNELMYHPSANPELEWVELHNQMAVNVELSGWTLSGGVEFEFAEGTVIPGGGYIVAAAAPAEWEAIGGFTNALGPWIGRLSNSGEKLELRNRDNRLMDELSYKTDGEWPAGADGAGVSLAKRNESSASKEPGSWTISALTGGTPGRRNFAVAAFEVIETAPVQVDSAWAWHEAAADSGDAWTAAAFNDSDWSRGPGLFGDEQATTPAGDLEAVPTVFSTGVGPDGNVLAPGSDDPHFILTQSAEPMGEPLPIQAIVIQNHPAWIGNDGGSSWIGPVNPGTENVGAGEYHYRTSFRLDNFDPATMQLNTSVGADNRLINVLLNGVAQDISFSGFSEMSGEFALSRGFTAGLNTLDFITLNESTEPNPAGFRVRMNAMARKRLNVTTELPPGSTSYRLRSPFILDAAPQLSTARLRLTISGGAIVFLNGSEVLRLNLPPGPIGLSTLAISNMTSPSVLGPWLLPNAKLVRGSNMLAVELHRGSENGSLLFGADLSVMSTNILTPPPVALAFNEIPAAGSGDAFWVEVINFGADLLDLDGCALEMRGSLADHEHVFAPRVIESGAVVHFTAAELGFGAHTGDRLFLKAPGGESVLDAVVVKLEPQARWPDGKGRWHFPTELTPGSSNMVVIARDVVINEIMYNPPEMPLASGTGASVAPETWLELHNRGGAAAALAGWRLAGDIDYDFPAAATLEPGGYLVVARDVGFMTAKHPGISIVGPFNGNLKKRAGRVFLLDSAGNRVDEARYFDAKPWPEHADGGGSSLELRDPWADHLNAAAWAASDESGRAEWTRHTYRGAASNALGPTQWKEFVLGLLDAGECLIDDLSVVQIRVGARTEMLQNGDFESGFRAWRDLGNHRASEVIADPEDPANHVLRLIATGPTGHLHNHLETTLANGMSVVNGREYEVSFRAKWVAGNNRLNTRLYFNRVARTTPLAMPSLRGTPGARNSTWTANAGPTFNGLTHSPVVPKAAEAVTVRVNVRSPHEVESVTLWRAAGAAGWESAAMSPTGPSDSAEYVTYETVLPGLPAGTITQFYVEAVDRLGVRAAFPAAGPHSRALFKVDDGKPVMSKLHRLRLLMTPADAQRLHASTNVMSNDRVGTTVVYDEQQVFYDVGAHLQGSERGRDSSSRVGFSIRFNSDALFRGTQNTITIDRSGGYSGRGGRHDELLLWHAASHAGGLLALDCDLVQCFAPRAQEDSTGLLRMAAFDADYFDAQFEDGSEGNLYTLELIYYPTTSVNGDPQAPKLPQPDDVINVDIQDRGDDPEAYRWIYLQENHANRDDYSQLVGLNKAFSSSASALEVETNRRMDADQWMRTLAFKAFTGDPDTFTYGLNHNWKIYFRPEDGKALGVLWDMDFAFAQSTDYTSPGSGSANTHRITRLPNNYRRFYSHLLDISVSTMTDAYLRPWAAHYSGLVAQDWSGAVAFLVDRARRLRSTMPLFVPFAITSNSGNDFTTSQSPVTLTGSAPLTVFAIEVDGVQWPVTWTSLTDWTVTLPLTERTQRLVLQGLDRRGNRLPTIVDSITITNSGALANQPVMINEWMADNSAPGGRVDPDSGLYSDWFELFNPNPIPIDLSGYFLSDSASEWDLFRVPANTSIAARGFLTLWADDLAQLNGAGAHNALHVNFRLGKDGETINLFQPDGKPVDTVTFGPQLPNVSQGLFPDGTAGVANSMPDWSPGAPNRLGEPPSPQIAGAWTGPDGAMVLTIRAAQGRTYRVEATDQLNSPVWEPAGPDRVAATDTLTIIDAAAGRSQRFYRIVLAR